MQIPALQLAREQGWTVYAADGNAEAPGRQLADHFAHIDLRERDELLAFAREVRRSAGLDGVFTAGTDFSTSVAWVAEHLGLPGIGYQTALAASDKQRMRALFAHSGIPSPHFQAAGAPLARRELDRLVRDLGLPLVVKPVDNMGARGVTRVDNANELRQAIDTARQHSLSGRALIEQFIEGPEFSIDAVIWRGRPIICGVADRHIRFPPHFIEIGHTMPTERSREDVSRLVELFCRAVVALGIHDGAAKGDVFLATQGPVVGEIAARLSGGYMSGWTYPYASGVQPTLAAMLVAMGEAPGDLEPIFSRVSAERAVISIPGVVRSVRGFEAARSIRGVEAVFQRCKAGERVVFPRNNVEKCGNVISAAADRAAADEAALSALRCIEIRLEPGDPGTVDFLLGGDAAGGAAAYPGLLRLLEVSASGRTTGLRTDALPDGADAAELDWNGRPLFESLQLLDPPHNFPVPRLFWRALAKGGLQGGRFLLDTVREVPNWRERMTVT